jgi:V8-like Glu-specific endopeptidase
MATDIEKDLQHKKHRKQIWLLLLVIFLLIGLIGWLLVQRIQGREGVTDRESKADSISTRDTQPFVWPNIKSIDREINRLLNRKSNLAVSFKALKDSIPQNPAEFKRFREIVDAMEQNDQQINQLVIYKTCEKTTPPIPFEEYKASASGARDFCNEHGKKVGMVRWRSDLNLFLNGENSPGSVNGKPWASGCLIGRDLFLTAGHCFDSTDARENNWIFPSKKGHAVSPEDAALLMRVIFCKNPDDRQNPCKDTIGFDIIKLEDHRIGLVDFAILRLAPNKKGLPGDIFGYEKIIQNPINPVNGSVAIIQYPGPPYDFTKRISVGDGYWPNPDYIYYDKLETDYGSSGAPVYSVTENHLVAVHVNGGCIEKVDHGGNRGVWLSQIVAASELLKKLAVKEPAIVRRRR